MTQVAVSGAVVLDSIILKCVSNILPLMFVKGVVYDYNPKTLCQIQRIAPRGPLAFRSVCVCSYTLRVARVEPPTQDVKY